MLIAPFKEVKKIISNYLTQRDITKEYSIGAHMLDTRINDLNALVTERDTTIAKAGREIRDWRKDWNEQMEANEKCRAKVRKGRRWILPAAVGGLVVGVLLGRL